MKKIVIFSLFFLITSCLMYQEPSHGHTITNIGNPNWDIYINPNSSELLAKDVQNGVYLGVDLKNILFGSESLNARECAKKNNTTHLLSVQIGVTSFRKGTTYTLNPNEVYMIKNNNHHPLVLFELLRSRSKVSDSLYDMTGLFERLGNENFTFKSPLICGELENAILVIGGVSVNGKPLSPIKIRINYNNPSQVPLYGNGR